MPGEVLARQEAQGREGREETEKRGAARERYAREAEAVDWDVRARQHAREMGMEHAEKISKVDCLNTIYTA